MDKQTFQHTAIEYAKSGLSIIPTNSNKRPALTEWSPFQESIADQSQIKIWFSSNKNNIAAIAGEVSGNFEIFDFDFEAEFFGPWAEKVKEQKPGLLEKLTTEKSPKGVHVAYRCPGTIIPGNTDLAKKGIEVSGTGEHTYKGKTLDAQISR